MEADKRLKACIDSFVQELTALIREATLEQLSAALSQDTVATSPASAGRGRGPKRSSEEIEAQCAQILAYLARNPGQGAETIASTLGTSSKGVNLALKKLLATRQISRKGRKRATKYFPSTRSS